MNTRLSIFIILLSVFWQGGLAQNTFEFELNYDMRKRSYMAIEDESGNIIALIGERTGVDYAPNSAIRSYLLKFSPEGDTSTITYNFGDTLYNFNKIQKDYHNGYLLIGQALVADSDKMYLMIVKVDESFNKVWVKYHDIGDYFSIYAKKLFQFNNKNLLVVSTCDFPCSSSYFNFIWIDVTGNILSLTQFDQRSVTNSDFLLSPDSSQLWVISMGMNSNFWGSWPIRMKFDTTFQFLEAEYLHFGGHGNINAKWLNDSSILYSFEQTRPNGGSNDSEMWLSITDTLLNIEYDNYFGEQDMKDIPGYGKNIDFLNSDSIFFMGFKHQKIGIPNPGRVNWIMTGQTDNQLQPRYLRFYGGDRYYEGFYVLATRDGGSFVCGAWYNHDTHVYNPVFLKLNEQGLITGSSEISIPDRKTIFWPVPFTSQLNYQTAEAQFELQLYDNMGRLVLEKSADQSEGSIAVDHLNQGLYFYKLTYTNNNPPEIGRILKTR